MISYAHKTFLAAVVATTALLGVTACSNTTAPPSPTSSAVASADRDKAALDATAAAQTLLNDLHTSKVVNEYAALEKAGGGQAAYLANDNLRKQEVIDKLRTLFAKELALTESDGEKIKNSDVYFLTGIVSNAATALADKGEYTYAFTLNPKQAVFNDDGTISIDIFKETSITFNGTKITPTPGRNTTFIMAKKNDKWLLDIQKTLDATQKVVEPESSSTPSSTGGASTSSTPPTTPSTSPTP